ncbi:nitrate- and nitrite sensing domain-containing protein [Streptomyces sp. MST-110588]|uniref:sensor histidine kinase n=1 Tax=Streptomyces sp. MST-110588 TaxID=2833628 RepID=UPI0024146026|nr:nitrate- and nitrite sensing domain-containing protein [Streptomyces sp. MST-110588]
MRKKRLRGGAVEPGSPAGPASGAGAVTGARTGPDAASAAGATPATGPVRKGRSARVRGRLVAAVAVVGLAVLGAGTPALLAGSDHLRDSQQLVDLAELNARAVPLAHSLADERDTLTEYAATGRRSRTTVGILESQRARVDRQLAELRAEARDASGQTPVYAAARKLLATLPQIRHKALTSPGSAADVFEAYTEAIQALNAVGDALARGLPARADGADADTRALPALGRSTEQASATRGLLLAALSAGGTQPRLTAAAQQARVREQGLLADFAQSAGKKARDGYDRTVNGTDVATAERYLARLTDQPRLDTADLSLNKDRIRGALTARLGLMRGVESAMATADVHRLGELRDADVTELELRIGLVGLCLLVAVATSVWAARSMTRPLAALRLGARRVAADPAHEEPIAFKGRDDEYAETVRSVNALHAKVRELARSRAELEAERAQLISGRQRLTAERETLQGERAALRRETEELAERLSAVRDQAHGRFADLSLRTLGLIERQLTVIGTLEERERERDEQDPERLRALFELDHFAARIRRNSESLLVLAGAEHATGHTAPVPLADVLRAAVGGTERHDRIRIQPLSPHARVAGYAAEDLGHLLAELLENATAFSPPDAFVELSGRPLESGEFMLSVRDEGIGMTDERLAELNDRLAGGPSSAAADDTPEDALGVGLYVVLRLAARHGVRVRLRNDRQGGVTAVVVLPGSLLSGPAAGADDSETDDSGAASATDAESAESAEADEPATAAEELAEGADDREGGADADTGADADGNTDVDADGNTDADADTDRRAVPAAGPYLVDPALPEAPGPAVTTSRPPAALPKRIPRTVPRPAPAAPSASTPQAGQEADASGRPPLRMRMTGAGLPKRTPQPVKRKAPAPARRSGGVNAEALRRRLGGFQQGARAGRRDVEAEIAERTAETEIAERTAETGIAERTAGRTGPRKDIKGIKDIKDTDGAGAPGMSHVVEEARD